MLRTAKKKPNEYRKTKDLEQKHQHMISKELHFFSLAILPFSFSLFHVGCRQKVRQPHIRKVFSCVLAAVVVREEKKNEKFSSTFSKTNSRLWISRRVISLLRVVVFRSELFEFRWKNFEYFPLTFPNEFEVYSSVTTRTVKSFWLN